MPLITFAPEQSRRHAFVVGTATSPVGYADISTGVRKELAAARSLLLGELGYRQETYRELVDPDESTLKKAIAQWRAAIAPKPDDWLLVYYTGHGVDRAGMLRLITVDATIPEVAVSAQDIVVALLGGDELPPHALLVFDTCQSGAAHLDTVAMAARLRESAGGKARGADCHVVATARSIQNATVSRFIEALRDAIIEGRAAGPDDEYVQLGPAFEQVNTQLGEHQRASYIGNAEAGLRFLPNPAWLPRLRLSMEAGTRQRVLNRIQTQALHGHWSPRSRGVASEHQRGWFFTGRAHALAHLVKWLACPSNTRGLIVRGRPGSGKSALLARIVTLADPLLRAITEQAGVLTTVAAAQVPAPNSIEVAIHARAKDPGQIALEIAAALDLEISSVSGDAEIACAALLAQRKTPVVIVVDALDESVRVTDVAAFLRALLRRAPSLRLVVGLRESHGASSALSSALGDGFASMDLDADEWWESSDVKSYAKQFLLAAFNSPSNTEHADLVDRLASAIAKRAGTSFLVANATAYALVARQDVSSLEALGELPATVGEAFELDLKRFPGLAGEQLRSVLGALAWSKGAGLPDAEWLAVSKALSGGDATEADLQRWRIDAGFYIVADEEFGALVSRLYHEEFAAHLRRAGGDATSVATALLDTVPRFDAGMEPDWSRASTYVLARYARHLSATNRTRELLDLVTGGAWASAKQSRFRDIGAVLADLDLAIDVVRGQQPLDVDAVVLACRAYARHAETAPAIVIDVLAALGQPTRALLMAEAIRFPLERCHAFSLLTARLAASGQLDQAKACLRQARQAARAITGHFSTMVMYWICIGAGATNDIEAQDEVRRSLNQAIDAIDLGGGGQRTANMGAQTSRLERSMLAFRLWQADQWSEHFGFALPHWLFWAAMCLRLLNDDDGLQRLRKVLVESGEFRDTNLFLQACAVAAPDLLKTKEPGGISKPGNLALALVEAGLTERFDALRAAGAFEGVAYPDERKRYAWALARRGDFKVAMQVANAITDDPEERARAIHRIAQVAAARADVAALDQVVSSAKSLIDELPSLQAVSTSQMAGAAPKAKGNTRKVVPKKASVPALVEPWRIQSWLSGALLMAGRSDEAIELAQLVVAASVAPSLRDSLAMATPRTAEMKGHVRLDSQKEPDLDLSKRAVEVAQTDSTEAARNFVGTQTSNTSAHGRAMALLALADLEANRDASHAHTLWIDALLVSRLAGTATVETVLERRPLISPRARKDVTQAS